MKDAWQLEMALTIGDQFNGNRTKNVFNRGTEAIEGIPITFHSNGTDNIALICMAFC
jgi:hypothetical protein